MNKKIKIGLLVFTLSLFVGVGSAHAVAPDLSWSSDTNITLSGNNYVIVGGSSATTLTVNGTTIVVLVPTGSTFTLKSANGYALNNVDGGSISASQNCDSLSQTSSIAIVGTGSTFTITPDITKTCFVSGGGGGQLPPSSSGGGGSSTTPPPVTPPTIPPVTPPTSPAPVTIPGCTSNVGFSIITGQSCVGNTVFAPTTPTGSDSSNLSGSSTYNFGTKTLRLGSKGEAVKELQKFLNQSLSLKLPVDGNFGQGTLSAVKKW